MWNFSWMHLSLLPGKSELMKVILPTAIVSWLCVSDLISNVFSPHIAHLTNSARVIKELVCGTHSRRCGILFLHPENTFANTFWFIFSFFNQAETLQLKYR